MEQMTNLRESTVVRNVAMVREAIADVAQLALFDVLFDGVKGLLLGDLHLGVGPAGDLDDHVENTIVLVGKEGDVVEGRHDSTILLDEDSVFCKGSSYRR